MKLIDLRPKRVGADLRGVCQLGSNVNQNEPEVQTYITGLITPLSSAQIGRLNTLVASLKSGLGISALSDAFDTLYVLAGETSESSLRNLVKNAHYATAVNSPEFTQFEGFKSNGTSSYINTNYNAVAHASKFTLNNASVAYYSTMPNNPGVISSPLGMRDISSICGVSIKNSGGACYYINDISDNLISYNNSLSGLFYIRRPNNTQKILSKNKNHLSIVDGNSVSSVNYNTYILCRNNTGSAERFWIGNISFVLIGRYFTDQEADAITDSIEAYMDSNGKGVIA